MDVSFSGGVIDKFIPDPLGVHYNREWRVENGV
jgi:hypothetical protein